MSPLVQFLSDKASHSVQVDNTSMLRQGVFPFLPFDKAVSPWTSEKFSLTLFYVELAAAERTTMVEALS